MTSRTPPRYVPTLTEVVADSAQAAEGVSQTAGLPPSAGATGLAVPQEKLVQRVMQRVDIELERKLREAIAATVIEQTRDMAPALRERIEEAVRQVVAQAVADEIQRR